MTKFAEMEAGQAAFSPSRTYRYWLRRSWDDSLPTVAYIGLNPSTADENTLDPTLRRCVGFATRWGYGSFVMVNLFAFRATNPIDMRAAEEPIGIQNDTWLRHAVRSSRITVCAWGNNGGERANDVLRMLKPWWPKLAHLGLNTTGAPKHPLRLAKEAIPLPYRPVLERLEAGAEL